MVYYEETVLNDLPCIEYDELTFYLYRLHEMIYTYTDENLPNTTTLYGMRPPGKSFVTGSLDLSTFTGQNPPPDNKYWWEHRVWLWYGTRVNIPSGN